MKAAIEGLPVVCGTDVKGFVNTANNIQLNWSLVSASVAREMKVMFLYEAFSRSRGCQTRISTHVTSGIRMDGYDTN